MFTAPNKQPDFVINIEGSSGNVFSVLAILEPYISDYEIRFLIENCTYSCIIARALIILGTRVTVISRVFEGHKKLINFYEFYHRYRNSDVKKIYFIQDSLSGYFLQAYDGVETFLPCDSLFGLKYNFHFMIEKYKKLQQVYINVLTKHLSIIKTMKKSLPTHIYKQTISYMMKFHRIYHNEPFRYICINDELYEPQDVIEQVLD